MKSKTKFLIKQSIAKKMDTKWFKLVNLLLCILLIAIINIDKIIGLFGGEFDEVTKIYVVDETNSFDSFKNYFESSIEMIENSYKFEILREDKDVSVLTNDLSNENDSIVIEILNSNEEYMISNIYSYNPLDMITTNVIQSTLTQVKGEYALANSGIDPNELIKIVSPITMDAKVLNENVEDQGAKDITSSSILMIFLIPFFILIVLLVQMIGAEINDEKTTRSMEIIISNVSPKTHFATKIVASTVFVLSQSILIFIYALLGYGLRMFMNNGSIFLESGAVDLVGEVFGAMKISGVLDALLIASPILIVIFILSFLAYALLAGILASMTTSTEDYQQLQTPLMLILMSGYYIGAMAAVFDGSVFIKAVSYIPFISALVAPITYSLGQTTLIDLGISAGALLLVCFLLFKYGIRVYKVGILNYSSKDLWKKVFKSLRTKEN